MSRPPPHSPLFPYTTLFRSQIACRAEELIGIAPLLPADGQVMLVGINSRRRDIGVVQEVELRVEPCVGNGSDRKSTRLNSSHSQISYAVFCLKKKRNT